VWQHRTVFAAIVSVMSIPASLMPSAAQQTSPQVISKVNHQMTGGVVDGPLEVSESLHVNGPLVVDGELVLGTVNPIFSKFTATSEGNAGAEVPGRRKSERWDGSWNVGGALVVHGPLIVRGTLYSSGGLTIGGLVGCANDPVASSVLIPPGVNPIGGPIQWKCE
jgi:hypothetical protein